MPATRTEIADHVGAAFGADAVCRDELLAAARASGARGAVLRALERLPDRSYRHLRELWPELPGVPVEHDRRVRSPSSEHE